MEYTEKVTFIIDPTDTTGGSEATLEWNPGEGLSAADSAFSSELALRAVQENAISRSLESGEEFDVTPEGPTLPTETSFKDIHAAVYFIHNTFPGTKILVDGDAPTLASMDLTGRTVDENNRPIIN